MTEPMMKQQADAYVLAENKRYFAIFHPMGCGKTRTAIELLSNHRIKERIDRVLIICPNSGKLVWEDELNLWRIDKKNILVINIEALSQGHTFDKIAMPFVRGGKCMTIIDESTKIKNHNTTRTKRCWKLGLASECKLILNGKPVTEAIHNLYSQYNFLSPNIIKQKSYYAFRNRYCIMGGFAGKQIIGNQNVDELLGLVGPFTHIVNKKEALPYLPDKVYEKRYADPSPEQRKHLMSLKKLMETEHNGSVLEVQTVLERLLRYQQIVGGFMPIKVDDGFVPQRLDDQPKLEVLLDLIDDIDDSASVIVWARFVSEAKMIMDSLNKSYPNSAVGFFGNDAEQKKQSNDSFRAGKSRFMVATQSSAARAMQWHIAKYAIYYSNSFSYDDRSQSEDRCHRKGSEIHDSITYIDVVMNHEIDKRMIAALAKKEDMSRWVENELMKYNHSS
jgi:SNF2 family DNA or RNA helicase